MANDFTSPSTHQLNLQRFTNARAFLKDSNAIGTNGMQLDASKLIPRFLFVKVDGLEQIFHVERHDTFKECAAAIDILEPSAEKGTRSYVYDLDTKHRYSPEVRVVGFNLDEDETYSNKANPEDARIDILSANLSTFMRGISVPEVTVTVYGGVAEIADDQDGRVVVNIVDFDNLQELVSEAEEGKKVEKVTLKPGEQKYIRENDPEFWARLSPLL